MPCWRPTPPTCPSSRRAPVADGSRQLLLAVDGGNSKTDLVIATTQGDVLAEVRGPEPSRTWSASRR